MDATIKIAISIRKSLFDQVEILTQQLNISQSQLIENALEDFIKNSYSQMLLDKIGAVYEYQPHPNEQAKLPPQDAESTSQGSGALRRINQGDIYWIQLEESSYPHPHVVIQDDVITRSRIKTVVVCGLTSNMNRANEPGNILLEAGEANLQKQSIAVVSQISTVAKTELGEYIGSLSKQRIDQILAGMRFQQLSFFDRYN